MGVLGEQMMGGKDHAGGADAALRAAFLEEALLDGVQGLVVCQTFYRGDVCTLGLQGGDKAGVDERAVHQHGAGAALTFAAAFFSAGKAQVLAEQIEEALQRRHGEGARLAVDGEGEFGNQWLVLIFSKSLKVLKTEILGLDMVWTGRLKDNEPYCLRERGSEGHGQAAL